MPLFSFDNLFRFADELSEPVPVAVAGGADRTVLEALRTACDRGWVVPFLVGVASDMRALAAAGIGLDGFTLVDAAEPAAAAVSLVRTGPARLLMKGQIPTPSLMTAVLDSEAGLRTGQVICQVVLMEIRPSGRRFLLADTGICIQPTLAQKADILGSAVAMAHTLGVSRPCVAVLAATETVTESMPETRDAAALQRRNQAGEFPGCVVRGPLSFDLAYDRDAALKKNLPDADFDVGDVLLFPNLVSANLTVKAMMYTADCRFGGVLCGAGCPVVFMSRADTTATRLNSLALALKLASDSPPIGRPGSWNEKV
ncbi:MAG TPA: phosphate acyltransferase [Gemmataceae bacterium]|jgi:phosphotransacetylase